MDGRNHRDDVRLIAASAFQRMSSKCVELSVAAVEILLDSLSVAQLVPWPAPRIWPSFNFKETVFMSDESDPRDSRNYQFRLQTFIDRLAFLIAKRWIREQQQDARRPVKEEPTAKNDGS